MAKDIFPQSQLPIRRTVELLPQVFQTDTNSKFMSAVVDPLVQPGTLAKTVGYVGRRYGKTYKGSDIYLDTDATLRSRYQLEPGVVIKDKDKVQSFYDYIDFKNQLKFFGNNLERDDLTTDQDHYSWNPPIDWDKFVNFREYYWVPDGPPPITIFGQLQSITSTYRVRLGVGSSWLFFPDGLTLNPTITLYRGQTYKFQVNAPNEGFVIKTAYDTGSLIYKPYLPYQKGQLAVFDNKLWRAKTLIPVTDGSTIDENSEDWEYVEAASQATALDYNIGVTNQGATNGTLTFSVPLDAPDVLFYQSATDINRFGRFIIADVESNTKIDVEKEIIGKVTYNSSNNIELSNGMKVRFLGQVLPKKYSTDTWIVEGVGESIKLIRFQDLVPPTLSTTSLEVLFDNEGFDTEPFDDAASYPESKDYITINRSSQDSNPWSRYNRWFHKSVLEQAHKFNESEFDSVETARAKRPIIEFESNLQLFNHGSVSKQPVDFIDTFTTDVFSIIEGSIGYNVDGEELFNGARILVTADTDSLANNKIYTVKFITHNNSRQINLVETTDSESLAGQGVFVRRGLLNKGIMYHFTGTQWVNSQKKTSVNQSPLFDVFDDNEISYGDMTTYPVSSFTGTKLVSYKVGTSVADKELGFSLSYLNIDNVGDIEFNFDWDIDSFDYHVDKKVFSKPTREGYYKFTDSNTYANGWIKTDRTYLQPIIYSTVVTESLQTSIVSDGIKWVDTLDVDISKILVYINGVKYLGNYTRNNNVFIFPNQLTVNDVVTIKVFANADPYQGYYEIPLGLEKNPLNAEVTSFTLGQAVDHVSTAMDLFDKFNGSYPGNSNLRDITGYQNLARRFLKHSGITPTAIMLLCDKQINVIKSIQHSKKSYTEFKNNFIKFSETLTYDLDPINFVDEILSSMSKIKTQSDAFADSDMVGCGAYTSKDYTVEDTGIITFALNEKFNLNELSRRAVYVYLNNEQLLHGQEYTFNSTFGFVSILKSLAVDDVIQIREYISSSFCFIPSTPTKLGLYKKYTPLKFLDDTYSTPREVIQGHDGSITVAYGDYRDDLLLELERRIYNNIKQQYSEDIFDIDSILGGYYGSSVYSKEDLDSVISSEFLRWLSETNIDYLSNSFFDSENSFTYTYSNMGDPTGTQNLPGWWRGVYSWFYDTDRPHRCPWEMLGFSEMPMWWEDEYGSAPYTKNNLLLWEDLSSGIVRQGDRAGVHDRYKRPTLLKHIPVDGDGNLTSPFESGLASNFVLYNNQGTFKFGDIAPVEYAWRQGSEYPFATVLALCLMRPYEFIIESLDKSRIKTNKIGQTVCKDTNIFFKNSDIVVPSAGGNQTSGLLNYLVDYLKSKGLTESKIQYNLDNLDVNLSTRLSGFVDQSQQKYILDSKNPKSSTSNIFLPPENYDINFNISSPIASPSYSAVVVEKLENGWKVFGYDVSEPYFKYFETINASTDPLISVGGVSENFVDWEPSKVFSNGTIIRLNDLYYRCLRSHTSGQEFDSQYWQRIAKLPLVGAIEVFRRRSVNKSSLKELPYGTIFYSLQGIADFIIGYEEYLKSQGFEFNGYDGNTEASKDWITSIKELLFWTKHKWAENSLITLSPAAGKIELNISIGVADNLLDGFYDYNILKDDGTILPVDFINVNREFQKLTVDTVNDVDGIYFFRCYFVLKEHVTVFDDKTVFNDVLYDKPTGYRQERIKSRGFRTVDWDGDYTSPGFLFDNVNIDVWQPFTDYKLGDIVAYKSYNWTSLSNQVGVESFNDSNWSKLDTTPEKSLVSNFDVKVNQFDDYYNVDADGAGASQRELARHLIGYQTREYLQNIAEDSVTQFKLYQGFIREKGTANAIVKIFDKLSRITDDSVVLKEEWAFNVGRLGGLDQLNEIEFEVNKDSFVVNPQAIIVTNGPIVSNTSDKYLRVNQTNFTRSLIPYTVKVNPLRKYEGITRNAGYVKTDQVEIQIKDKAELLTLDINTIVENSHIWLTFDNASWSVLRFNLSKELRVVDIIKDSTTNIVTITLNQKHGLVADEIIGIKDIENLTGFYQIISATDYIISVQSVAGADPNPPDISTIQYNIYLLKSARFENYQTITDESAALLKEGAKLWVDNADSESGNWEVVEKQRLYSGKNIAQFGATTPKYTGRAVVYSQALKQTITGMPLSNAVMSYAETATGLAVKQILQPEPGLETLLSNSFGDAIAISPDNVWLAVGAPLASGIPSRFKDKFDPLSEYFAGDIVLHNGKLWEATDDQRPIPPVEDDGSTNTLNELSEKFRDSGWKLADIVYANQSGVAGPTNQGMVVLYKWKNNAWELQHSILSPRIDSYEKFGSKISIGVSGSDYYMSVSAPGSLNNLGRVYLYKYNGTTARTTTQVLTFNGTSAINYTVNTILFSRNHNFVTGQLVRYLNGTYQGDDKSAATSPPPPEDYTVVYAIRVTDTVIQLASTISDALNGVEIDLKDFGIDDSSSHTLISTVISSWKQLGDPTYRGIYNPSSSAVYTAGSKVWYNGNIYQALEDVYGDGTSLDLHTSHSWQLLDSSVTEISLPTNIALIDTDSGGNDNSTLRLGSIYPLVTAGNFIVGETYTIESFGTTDFQSIGYNDATKDGLTFKANGKGSGTGTARWKSYEFAELVKAGDLFGSSQAMNRDGSILVIGAPESDGKYFSNYRGVWNSYTTYVEDDVVKHNDTYYRLRDTKYDSAEDSTTIVLSKNQTPSSVKNQHNPTIDYTDTNPWWPIEAVSTNPSGKIFIYKRNLNEVYELIQTITTSSIIDINDTGETETLSTGDKFGSSVDIDFNGTTIIASSPLADVKFADQGAVFIFKTDSLEDVSYRLKQKLISHENYTNEYFGSSISISPATERIVVGAVNSSSRLFTLFDSGNSTFDNTNTIFSSDEGNTGQVYVFERKDQTYHLTEKLYTTDLQNWESFGQSIDCVGSAIVVGSPTYRDTFYRKGVGFTTTNAVGIAGSGLTVDVTLGYNSTTETYFVSSAEVRNTGVGYTVSDFNNPDDFIYINGSGVSDTNRAKIKIQTIENGEVTELFVFYEGTGYTGTPEVIETGQVRIFTKDLNKNSWNTLASREELVDLDLFNSIAIYDNQNNVKLSDVEIVDHFKLKILGAAEQELKFKTLYDPAIYTNGTDQQEVDESQAWAEKYVGQLWWDLSTAKWLHYEQSDTAYRIGNWNQLAYGASIDIYEWVETRYLPSQWAELADTTEGLSLGISGVPLYADDTVYSIRVLTNSATGETTNTKYYYWVKNKNIVPNNVPGRRMTALDVKSYIENPIGTGQPMLCPISSDAMLAFNFESLISSNTALINIQYRKNLKLLNPIHNEYQLLTDGVADSLPTDSLETKWLDSLVGFDKTGNIVPDVSIPIKQRYGLSFRPRQGMFKDRFPILRTVITNINTVLTTRAFADTLNFENLNSVDSEPNSVLNEYDVRVDTLTDLDQVGTTRVKKAALTANIVDGEIDTIDITDSGFGYKNAPYILIEGDGQGATAQVTIDGSGRINSVTVLSKGKRYTTATVQIRYFSVLVAQDSSINNYWSIYSWDNVRKAFFRSKSQAYNTAKYWEYVDWWNTGYGPTSRTVKELLDLYQEPSISVEVGDLIRIKEFANGGWAVLEKTETNQGNILDNYNLVGRQNGTIKLKIDDLISVQNIGYDNTVSFDSNLYDLNPTQELRNIFKAVKEDIFLEDLKVEWNKLFFTCIRYAFVEQPYIDWAFKTSFLNAIHNVGNLEQKISYKNDNLESFQQYIEEVKPYRTTIREYTSRYIDIDKSYSGTSDFDLPPIYSNEAGQIIPVKGNDSRLANYPWKWWSDNNGYSVTEILVSNGGADYTQIPNVVIDGNGTGAIAQAFISNGSVVAVKVLTAGSGYTKAPTISLVGGNGTGQNIAKAVAIISNTAVRTFDITVKFDRLAKQGLYKTFADVETFIATGNSAIFELKYAPNRDKSKISIKKNNQIVLSSEYGITLYSSSVDTYSLLKGKLIFKVTPIAGDVIEINYEKNIELFDSINRIENYYLPMSGMRGNELSQLMTGIDFGGVQIQGTTFDVTGGWDALPWFTDSWDSVESNSDFYYVADGSTISVTLPFTPVAGEQISVYWKPSGTRIPGGIQTLGSQPDGYKVIVAANNPAVIKEAEISTPKTIRIDDPNWIENWDSSNATNPSAQMPTFIGDGSTRVVEIGKYLSVEPGDTLIFRKLDSDGSVTITDVNLLDTKLSGGSLSNISGAYQTATGLTSEEIIVDGDKFISPDQVPAPEENIPGQVLESVSIKVYHTYPQGAAPLQNKVIYSDGIQLRYDIGLKVFENNAVLVYINKTKQDIGIDYTIDYVANEIVFETAPATSTVVEILAFGVGGIDLLDYQEFIADGATSLFLTKAIYNQTDSILATVNGDAVDARFIDSADLTDTEGRTLVQFGFSPSSGSVVKVVCLGPGLDTDSTGQSIVRVNQQTISYDGSTTRFVLDKFVSLTRASALSSILVTINNQQLKGPDTVLVTYNGSNNEITIGVDPLRSPGSITYPDIKVFINNNPTTQVVDWTLNSGTNVVTVRADALNVNDVIRIVVNAFADYQIDSDEIIFTDTIMATLENNDDSTIKDIIDITWFSEYPSMDIVSDQYAGAQVSYQLSRVPVNSNYVWVYVNGSRLTNNKDYSVSLSRAVVYLNITTTADDDVKIVEFGNDIYRFPSAFEIYKDMLNIYHFKRYSRNDVKLASDLNYYDQSITVTNGDQLFDPTDRRIAGSVYINNERIEYLQKTGNVLTQLRRGSLGTAIAELHKKDSFVSDSGPLETIPYNETQHRLDFVSDGSTLLVGPLDFTPNQGTRKSWFRSTIPESYGPCDQIEVFVAGTRLRKNPIDIFDEDLGPTGSKEVEAEFSVDGASPYIRLTSSIPAGTRITIIRKTGRTWYDRGVATASSGKTLQQNKTAISEFILQKTTIIPE
jgi:hypothetical protein